MIGPACVWLDLAEKQFERQARQSKEAEERDERQAKKDAAQEEAELKIKFTE